MRLAAAALALVALAACGGGAISRETFIERADLVCRDALDRAEAIPTADSDLFAERLLELNRSAEMALGALALRSDLRAKTDADALAAAFRSATDGLEAQIVAARADDALELERARRRVEAARARFDALAERLGLTGCLQRRR